MVRFACCLVLLSAATAFAQDKVVEEAAEALKAGRHSEALDLIESSWSKLKENAAAVEIAAEASVHLNRFDAGMDYGLRLTKLSPDNPAGRKWAGRSFLGSAKERATAGEEASTISALFESAMLELDAYLAARPNELEDWKLLGEAAYFAENQKKAIAAFDAAAKLAPKDASILILRARSERAMTEMGLATQSLQKAVELDPKMAAAHIALGDIFGAQQQLKRAVECYGKALTCKDITDEDAGRMGTFIWQIAGSNLKDLDLAYSLVEGWSKAHPKAMAAWWWRGFYALQKNDPATAIKDYERCFEVSGETQADAAEAIGNAYARMATPTDPNGQPAPARMNVKNLEAAATWYMKAERVADWNWNGNPPVRRAVGLFSYMASNGKLDEGAKLLEQIVLPAAPKDWMVLNNLGLYYRDLGGAKRSKDLCDKSRKYYDRAAEAIRETEGASAQEKAGVFNDAGVLYHFPNYLGRDFEKGMAYYREALEADPDWIDANENMGLCLNELGRFAEAIPHFDKVLSKTPERMVSKRGKAAAERGQKGR